MSPPHPSTAAQVFPGGHAIPAIGQPSTSLRLHAPAPPLGLVLASTLPEASPATHSDAEGHVIAWMTLGAPSGASTLTGEPHVPLTGSVEVTMEPLASPATHRVVVGQEITSSGESSTLPSVQAFAPAVGLVECQLGPGAVDGHAQRRHRARHPGQRILAGDVGGVPGRRAAGGVGGGEHVAGGVGGDAQARRRARHRQQGAVGVDARPIATPRRRRRGWWSAARCRAGRRRRTALVEGQAIAVSPLPASMAAEDHPVCPMPGAVECSRLPLASTA